MATKLRGLKVKKVDFVDEGANPDAHITLYKNRDGEPGNASRSEHKESIWKRLFGPLAKLAGVAPEELDNAVEAIEKSGAMTFSEQMNERKTRKIADEMWDICFALQNSLASIMRDEELDSDETSQAMQESLDDFVTVVEDAISRWSLGKTASIAKKCGKVTKEELDDMKSARDKLDGEIKKASADLEEEEKKPAKKTENPKGEEKEMNIDKSKLTPGELAFLEEIEKKCGVKKEDPDQQDEEQDVKGKKGTAVGKSISTPEGGTNPSASEPAVGDDDIYKGLNPAVKAEIVALRKFREEAEDRELHQLAKKYTIIGKKEEELVPMLKSLKAAGGTAYADMVSMMDAMVAATENSGMFTEIGKSGGYINASPVAKSASEGRVDVIAKGYMEKDPSMSYADAVAKAWENNPDLLAEYDREAGL